MARKGSGDGGRVRTRVTGNDASAQSTRRPTGNLYVSDYAILPPLLAAEGRRLPKVLWEPHAGSGALVKPLRRRGYTVTATDLMDWGCPASTAEIDFLGPLAGLYAPAGDGWGIVANPPFDNVEGHIERAARLAPYAAVFLRFSFFEGEGRFRWWNSVGLQRVILIVDRLPMMHGEHVPIEDRTMKQAGMAFAWFIFEQGKRPHRQFPVRLVSWKEAARRFPKMPGDEPVDPKAPKTLFDESEASDVHPEETNRTAGTSAEAGA